MVYAKEAHKPLSAILTNSIPDGYLSELIGCGMRKAG